MAEVPNPAAIDQRTVRIHGMFEPELVSPGEGPEEELRRPERKESVSGTLFDRALYERPFREYRCVSERGSASASEETVSR